jgi:hypothetical protein
MKDSLRNRTGLIATILVILGLMVGIAIGLVLGWIVWPVEFVGSSIADLAPEQKDEYMFLVASAYASDGSLEKAQERLAQMEVPNVNQSLVALIDRYMFEGREEGEIQVLARLADSLGVTNPKMLAYLVTPTPLPTDTPPPTPTPLPSDTPTATPVPPTDTPVPPTDTPQPTATDTVPVPTNTAVPPTNTPLPPTATPRPQPTNTPRPQPTNTPKPTNPPAARWTWSARLVGPGEDSQGCTYGNLQIRVTVVDANGSQLGGVWVYDRYSGQYQLTGNVDSVDWGPGETKFEYGGGGGGSVCIATGQGGACVSEFTRDMPCYNVPPVEDLFAAGYCGQCCEVGATLERCRQLVNEGKCMGNGHYSWRVVFTRNW